MIENLFGVVLSIFVGSIMRQFFKFFVFVKSEIFDLRKVYNIVIQLCVWGLLKMEVCDVLVEGEGLDQEILEIFVKMIFMDEEIIKFK